MLCVVADLILCFRLEHLKARKSLDVKTLPQLRTLLRPLVKKRQLAEAGGVAIPPAVALSSYLSWRDGMSYAGHAGYKGMDKPDWWPLQAWNGEAIDHARRPELDSLYDNLVQWEAAQKVRHLLLLKEITITARTATNHLAYLQEEEMNSRTLPVIGRAATAGTHRATQRLVSSGTHIGPAEF
jgi:hypothetical protein